MLSRPGERVKKLNLAAKYSSPKSKRWGSIEVYNPAMGKYDTVASTEPVHEAALAADDNEARRASGVWQNLGGFGLHLRGLLINFQFRI